MKAKTQLAAAAQAVDTAHDKVVNSRRDLKRKREAFLLAETTNQQAEATFQKSKEAHTQQLNEKF